MRHAAWQGEPLGRRMAFDGGEHPARALEAFYDSWVAFPREDKGIVRRARRRQGRRQWLVMCRNL